MTLPISFAAVAVVAGALYAVDRLLLWCEQRGWIRYRKSPRIVRRAASTALLEFQQFLQPEKRHVIELEQASQQYREQDKRERRSLAVPARPNVYEAVSFLFASTAS